MAEETKRVFTVNGKEVRIRPRLPLSEGAKIPELLGKAASDDMRDWIPLFQLLLEPCELVANPADAASYDALDVFEEVYPLGEAVGNYALSRINAARQAAKN